MERDISLDALLRPYEEYDFFGCEPEAVAGCFAGSGEEYDPMMSWLLAEASMLAYAREASLVREPWTTFGLEQLHLFDGKGAQGYLAVLPEAAVLVFRGTEPDDLHDILADMKFMLVNHGGSGLVHSGFEQALGSVWEELAEILDALGDRPVWVAGHSLGAALALLAGARLGAVRAVYTYGAPRIGTRGFRDEYPVPAYRVSNNNDLVTMIPPPIFYRHVGDTWFIDHEGWVRSEDATSSRDRMESRFWGHMQHANDVLKLWSKMKFLDAIPNSNVTDHAPVNYVRALREALERASFRVARLLEEAESLSPEEQLELANRLRERLEPPASG